MHISKLANLALITASLLLMSKSTNAQLLSAEDAPFDLTKSKTESEKFLHIYQRTDAQIEQLTINHVVECMQDSACDFELMEFKVDSTLWELRVNAHMLYVVYDFYHKLMMMQLDPRDELAARTFMQMLCGPLLINNDAQNILVEDELRKLIQPMPNTCEEAIQDITSLLTDETQFAYRPNSVMALHIFTQIRKSDRDEAQNMIQSLKDAAIINEALTFKR